MTSEWEHKVSRLSRHPTCSASLPVLLRHHERISGTGDAVALCYAFENENCQLRTLQYHCSAKNAAEILYTKADFSTKSSSPFQTSRIPVTVHTNTSSMREFSFMLSGGPSRSTIFHCLYSGRPGAGISRCRFRMRSSKRSD